MKLINRIKSLKYEIIVFIVFIVSHLPSLGYDTFNTDVWKWKARIFDFGSGVFNLNFVQTIQKYHPGVTLMWIGTVVVKFFNLYYDVIHKTSPPDNDISVIFQLHSLQKLFIVLVIGFSLSLIFYGIRKIFNLKYSVILLSFLVIEPFYVALTRELHLEGLMSTFMIVSFVWFYLYLQDKSRNDRFIISAFFASLAVLTKTSSLFILPFVLFSSIYNDVVSINQADRLFISLKSLKIKDILKLNLKYIFLFNLFFFLIWPAMWTNAVSAIQTMYRGIFTIGIDRGHIQLFFGKNTLDPGLLFYPVVFWLRSSVYLVIGLIGFLFISRKLSSEKRKFSFLAFIFAFLSFLELTIPSAKLDRYFLPIQMVLWIPSAFFYEYLLNSLRLGNYKFKHLLFPLIILPGVLLLFWIHPDYFSYYSPLGGGLKSGINIIEPKWMIGQKQTITYLGGKLKSGTYVTFKSGESLENTKDKSKKLTVAFQEKYYTQIWPFVRKIGGWAVIEDLTPQARETNLFIYPVWDDSTIHETRFKLKYIDSIFLRGVKLYNVYERI